MVLRLGTVREMGRRARSWTELWSMLVMGSELGGCQRVLRDDLRPSENTREREREGWG